MASSQNTRAGLTVLNSGSPIEKFPTYLQERTPTDANAERLGPAEPANGHVAQSGWQTRKDGKRGWIDWKTNKSRHRRQKSLSDAIRTIRVRKGSISANAHEIADALKAPVSPQIIMLCAIWFTASVLSNTSSKTILTAFSKPVTLTLVQFWFVSTWCLFAAWLAQRVPLVRRSLPLLKDGIRWPTKALVRSALPLAAFQVGGHILSSDAMAKMSVPLVHTIKGLSPLFTVLAYRLFFGVRYSTSTYLALVPLILGVMMACSANFSANFVGLSYALGSALLFVTQNIVSKKLFNDAAAAEYDTAPVRFRKPDKLNLLCYSSGIAFLTTIPLWLWSEGFGIMSEVLQDASVNLSTKPGAVDHGRLALEFIFNGVFHFVQNMVAFVLLSMVSPVTYSVASLFKRVFVILFALVWFGNRMTTVQAVGIALTFVGLYLYDRCGDATRVERSGERVRSGRGSEILPVVTERKTEQFHANHK